MVMKLKAGWHKRFTSVARSNKWTVNTAQPVFTLSMSNTSVASRIQVWHCSYHPRVTFWSTPAVQLYKESKIVWVRGWSGRLDTQDTDSRGPSRWTLWEKPCIAVNGEGQIISWSRLNCAMNDTYTVRQHLTTNITNRNIAAIGTHKEVQKKSKSQYIWPYWPLVTGYGDRIPRQHHSFIFCWLYDKLRLYWFGKLSFELTNIICVKLLVSLHSLSYKVFFFWNKVPQGPLEGVSIPSRDWGSCLAC